MDNELPANRGLLRSGTRTTATKPIVAFIVDGVVAARAEIVATGIELLSEVIWAADGFGWFFLRAPDGNIYCIEQVPE